MLRGVSRKLFSALVLLSFGLSGLGCGDDTKLGRVAPVVTVDREQIDFGLVFVGSTRRIPVAIGNVGTADLEISGLATAFSDLAGDNPFLTDAANTLLIPPGGQVLLDVSFRPAVNEIVTGSLSFETNDPERPEIIVGLQGQGGQGQLVVQPIEIDLRDTTVGRTRSVEFVVRNLGAAPLENARIVTEGFERPQHFRVTGLPRFDQPAPFALDARVRQVLMLTYEPQALGDDNGIIRIETCGPRCGPEIEVLASAQEAVVRLVPPTIAFGGVGIGQPMNEALQVENVGTEAATIESVGIAGSAAFGFDIPSGNLPRTLQPGERLGVTVTFTPTEATAARGAVVVQTNLPSVPELQASLTGEGEGPLFLVSPETISFGTERGPGTYRRLLLLINAGSSQVQVSSVSIAGDAELALGGFAGLPARLGPGESLTVPVVFQPVEIGQYMATMTVGTDDPARPSVTVPVVATMSDRVCDLAFTPSRIQFGQMPPGHARIRSVEVANRGNDFCQLESAAFREPIDPDFRFLGSTLPFPAVLVPTTTTATGASSLELEFEYAPTERRVSKASFVIQTNDRFFPERTVSLSGQSEQFAQVIVRPETVDFGAMQPNFCPEFIERVTLFNIGQRSVNHARSSITSATQFPPSTEFRITNGSMIPNFLQPGGAFVYELGYRAIDFSVDDAELEISFSDLPQPIVVPLTGRGEQEAIRTENFQQVTNKEVDVLFVIDDSCSMAENQRQVASNFDRFIREADTRQVDFRLGITTTDTTQRPGVLVGPVISRATPDFQARFRAQAAVGTRGSGIETGLEAMQAALDEASRGNGFNADLIRPTAALVVIIVSDEDDQSPLSPPTYANDLNQRTTNGVLAAVVSGQSAGCSTPLGDAFPAPGYEQFLSFFGGNGLSESICADWGQTLADLGGEAFGLRRSFRLAIRPSIMPVAPIVMVDGMLVPPSDYSVVGNDIVFNEPPPEGATIVVEYRPDCS